VSDEEASEDDETATNRNKKRGNSISSVSPSRRLRRLLREARWARRRALANSLAASSASLLGV
jgi:hypothetical protein